MIPHTCARTDGVLLSGFAETHSNENITDKMVFKRPRHLYLIPYL